MSKSKFTYPKCPYCKSEYQDGVFETNLSELAIRGWNRVTTVKCKRCNEHFDVSVHITYYGRKRNVKNE